MPKAIARALPFRSATIASSVVRPIASPDSSAASTRTSNHDSMLFPRNCTDTR